MYYPGPAQDLAEFFGVTFAIRTVPHDVRLDRREVQVFSLIDDPHQALLAKRLTRELECYHQPRPVGRPSDPTWRRAHERQHGWLPVKAERIAHWLRGRMHLASRTKEAWSKDAAVAWDEYLSVTPSGTMHEVDIGDESAQARMRVIHALMDGYREYLDQLEREWYLDQIERDSTATYHPGDALNPTREVSFAFDSLLDREPSEPAPEEEDKP